MFFFFFFFFFLFVCVCCVGAYVDLFMFFFVFFFFLGFTFNLIRMLKRSVVMIRLHWRIIIFFLFYFVTIVLLSLLGFVFSKKINFSLPSFFPFSLLSLYMSNSHHPSFSFPSPPLRWDWFEELQLPRRSLDYAECTAFSPRDTESNTQCSYDAEYFGQVYTTFLFFFGYPLMASIILYMTWDVFR